ncbi:MAG: hypothetical protein PWR02_1915 [Synergistales bacterium]|jgi:hypothetical protein|nr:hypothetical protein [Synergistales bacterium]
MKKTKWFPILLSAVLVLLPVGAFAEPADEPVVPDPVQAANNFITGLTGSSPAALGLASDAQVLAAIGEAVLKGDFGNAAEKLGDFTAGKLIGYTAPAIGQIIAIGNIGKMAGDAAVTWVGQKNFEKIYDTMLETVGPVEKWPRTREEAARDEFFQATMAAEYRYLETYLIERGFAANRAEAEKVAVDMILAKGNFERLCDEYGLKGKDRTYEKLQREVRIEAEVAAEIARERELARAERLEQERLEREKAESEKTAEKEDIEAELEAEMAALEEEKQQVQAEPPDPGPEKPAAPRPDDVIVVETKPQEQSETKPESVTEPKRVLAWNISPSAGDDQTVFTVTVTNLSDSPITGFSCSIDPTGPYSDGGVGWGSSPSFSTIGPGKSITFTALAMGDVKGLAFSFYGNGKALGSDRLSSVHQRKIDASGRYNGVFSAKGISGEIHLIVEGTSLSGSLSGNYSDPDQNVAVTAQISGSFDPQSGTLSARWSGIAAGTMKYDGENHDVYEPVLGTLQGSFSKGVLSGTWSGGSDYVTSSGSWQAN